MAAAAPDAVVHVLTALPKTGPRRRSHLEATNALRTRGTANLIQAAVAGGARRLMAESNTLGYGHGGQEVVDEARPLMEQAPLRSFQDGLDTIRSLEEQVLQASRSGQIEGIALRYGLFYGPGAGTDYMLRMLRRRLLPLPGGGGGVASWIHVEDAASATVAALEKGRPGQAYNVVDDEPVSFRDFFTELARMGAAPPPRSIPVWVARLAAPYPGVILLVGRLQRLFIGPLRLGGRALDRAGKILLGVLWHSFLLLTPLQHSLASSPKTMPPTPCPTLARSGAEE